MAKIDVKGQLVACALADEFNKDMNEKASVTYLRPGLCEAFGKLWFAEPMLDQFERFTDNQGGVELKSDVLLSFMHYSWFASKKAGWGARGPRAPASA